MLFEILTLFPSMFEGVFAGSIIGRAVERKLISIHVDNIRDYALDRHKTVDDYPYGGGPGMLMKPEPLARAITAARQRHAALSPAVILLSPQGKTLDQAMVRLLAARECLILVCGRYEGVDYRVRERYVDKEVSIGDYVLSGGEIPAMVVVEAVSRVIPGVLGNRESAAEDSFSDGLLAPPQYTRPEIFEGMAVPPVLLSGHHEHVRQWQREQSMLLTRKNRPDLWEQAIGSDTENEP